MNKSTGKLREEARKLYLTGDIDTNAEIAARLKLKPHTVGAWRKHEDWDGLKLKIQQREADKFIEKIATDRTTMNLGHYRYWALLVSRLGEVLKSKQALTIKDLESIATVLDRAQKGQRLAKGLASPAETEEALRAKSQAELGRAMDIVRDAIKEHVTDEDTRDRIARAILGAIPQEPGAGAEQSQDEVRH